MNTELKTPNTEIVVVVLLEGGPKDGVFVHISSDWKEVRVGAVGRQSCTQLSTFSYRPSGRSTLEGIPVWKCD